MNFSLSQQFGIFGYALLLFGNMIPMMECLPQTPCSLFFFLLEPYKWHLVFQGPHFVLEPTLIYLKKEEKLKCMPAQKLFGTEKGSSSGICCLPDTCIYTVSHPRGPTGRRLFFNFAPTRTPHFLVGIWKALLLVPVRPRLSRLRALNVRNLINAGLIAPTLLRPVQPKPAPPFPVHYGFIVADVSLPALSHLAFSILFID